jgi:hypothetical protein
MRKTFFFQYDVKPEHRRQYTQDRQIDVLIEWHGQSYTSGRGPIVFVQFPYLPVSTLCIVTDWNSIVDECEKIGEKHFAEEAKAEQLAQARAVLNEFENPILERFAQA